MVKHPLRDSNRELADVRSHVGTSLVLSLVGNMDTCNTKGFQEVLIVLQASLFINQETSVYEHNLGAVDCALEASSAILVVEHEVIASCFTSERKVPLERQSATDLDASFEDAYTSESQEAEDNNTHDANAEGDNPTPQGSTFRPLRLAVSANPDHGLNVLDKCNNNPHQLRMYEVRDDVGLWDEVKDDQWHGHDMSRR